MILKFCVKKQLNNDIITNGYIPESPQQFENRIMTRVYVK